MELTENIKRLLNVKSVADRMSNDPGFGHFFVLPKYINERNYQMGVEIGVAYAGHSQYLLANCPQLKWLVGVDPYKFYDVVWAGIHNQADMEDMYLIAKDCTKHDKRFLLIRESSNEFFRGNAFDYDFIFIDGDHSYEQVKQDINNLSTLIRPGGMLCGHDYHNIAGVAEAVDEFIAMSGKTLIKEEGTIWIINY